MTVYFTINQLTYPIAEFKVDREWTITRAKEPFSELPEQRGNEIVLPYCVDRPSHPGVPVGRITPATDFSAEYTALFEVVPGTQYYRFKDYSKQPLKMGDTLTVSLEDQVTISIGWYYLKFTDKEIFPAFLEMLQGKAK
ncbi:hypothetical protein KY363_01950 [Candidatus Woesearchaeota archaeon]|nr:hypothetical protein [Candidatus Woesearchaeota archaeon]